MRKVIFIFIIFFQLNIITNSQDLKKEQKKTTSDKINQPNAINDVINFKNENGNAIITITDEGSNVGSITLPSGSAPATTTNKLYNVGGSLNFNGITLGSGGATEINDLTDAKYDGSSLFLGSGAGNSDDGLNNNTAVGYQALLNNSSGNYNTAVSFKSLNSNTTGGLNSAFGYQSLYYNTTGNENSAFGLNSLLFNKTGNGNSAFGTRSLYSNSAGINNTAIGQSALSNNHSGNNATAVGYQAMYYANNTMAAFDNFNVAVGYEALRGSTTPANNTGNNNTAVGYMPLRNNSSGNYNSAFGISSLYLNTAGYDNSAVGSYSLNSNTTGYQNSAFGRSSLYANTTGYQNSAFGSGAGQFITSGSNLTCIGYNAQPTSGSATNQITLGNNQITSLRCNVTTITSLSDARDKMNIKDLNIGVDFLMKIKPRLFNWDKREWYDGNISNGSKMKQEQTAGFIAQELDEVQTEENAEWLKLVLKDNPDKLEATPGNLLPIIVKAIQELNKKIEALEKENEKLENQLTLITEVNN